MVLFSFSKEPITTDSGTSTSREVICMTAINTTIWRLKVVATTLLLVCLACLKESTLEARKHVFYCTLKALLVLEIIKF